MYELIFRESLNFPKEVNEAVLCFLQLNVSEASVHLNVKERLSNAACLMIPPNSHVRKLHSMCNVSQDTWVNGQYNL